MIRRTQNKFFEHLEQTPPSSAGSLTPTELWSHLQEWREQLEKKIAAHPGASLAAAVAAGFLIGWWTKRK